jgi:SNF2 family DNA or RNA helicase
MSEVFIEKQGRRIQVNGTGLTGIRTAVPGAYQSSSGGWTVPLSIESAKLLREKYGNRLRIGSKLRTWLLGVRRNRDAMAKLAAAKDAKLYVLPNAAPKLYKAMRKRKYQRVGVRFVASNHASLEADDPGLGKTLIAMGGILEAEVPGPYLVIAPKTASDSVWKREIERWLPKPHRAITVADTRLQRERILRFTTFGPHTWVIVHPEMVMVQTWLICQEKVQRTFRNRKTGRRYRKTVVCGVRSPQENRQKRTLKMCKHIKTRKTKRVDEPSYPQLFDMEWGAIIIDESHESLIRRKGVPTQRRNGMDKLKVRADGIRIAMSGTPHEDKPHQLWGTLNWLDPVQYSAFHRWAELYWKKGGYSGWEIGEFIQEREQMLWDSLSAIALRRTKAEVAQDLPPKTYVGTPYNPLDENSPHGIWLDMDGKQAKAYEQMERDSVSHLDSGRLEAVSALAELTRLKQLACSYGRLEVRRVKGRCQKQTQIADPKYWCNQCRAYGYHMEDREFFIPELPSNKFNWIRDTLEEWGYPNNPIDKVVFGSFYSGIMRTFAHRLEAYFKTKPGKRLSTGITGLVSKRDRAQRIEQFNREGEGPYLMWLNVKAGGTAITIDSASRTVLISETRIPSQQTQLEDRTHRVSNPRSCFYYYLRSLGTVDVGTSIVNQELAQASHRLLDGRRGVEYLRHIVDLSRG